ncbi:TPA: hypothetical protein DIV55_03760 [Patescibacteria group bacterium]|nr:hypothetical protein [Patescibacteria group bacterium]
MHKTTFEITGMHCASCQKLVSRALAKVPGVVHAEVNLMTNKAYVEHEGELNLETAKKEVEGVGYGIRDNLSLSSSMSFPRPLRREASRRESIKLSIWIPGPPDPVGGWDDNECKIPYIALAICIPTSP